MLRTRSEPCEQNKSKYSTASSPLPLKPELLRSTTSTRCPSATCATRTSCSPASLCLAAAAGDQASMVFAEAKPLLREQELEAQVTALRQAGQEGARHRRAIRGAYRGKNPLGPLTRRWVPHDLPRCREIDFLRSLHQRTELPLSRLITWSGISSQVLRLGGALRQSPSTQCPDSSRPLAAPRGETGHRGLPCPLPAGGLPPLDLHDARRRYRRMQPRLGVSRAVFCRPAGSLEQEAQQEGHRLSCSRCVLTSTGMSISRI